MDSAMNLRKKTTEGEGVGARSLTCNTSGVEGCVGAPRWDYKDLQVRHLLTRTCTNQLIGWLVRS